MKSFKIDFCQLLYNRNFKTHIHDHPLFSKFEKLVNPLITNPRISSENFKIVSKNTYYFCSSFQTLYNYLTSVT